MPSNIVVVIAGQDSSGAVLKQVESNLARLKSQAADTGDGFTQMAGTIRTALGAVGASIGFAQIIQTMKAAVTSSLEFGQQIENASKRTGLAVGTLSTLHYAAAVTGNDFDGMTTAVARMDREIGQATQGNKQAQEFMRSLGLNAQELAGRTDGAEVAFRRFAQALADTESPVRRVQLATGLLGRAGAEQIPVLMELGKNWDMYRQQAEAAGVQLNGQTAASLAAMNRTLEDAKQHIQGASIAFTEGLIPALREIVQDFTGANGAAISWQQAGQRTGLIAMGIAYAFAYVSKSVRQAADEYKDWEAHINGMGDKLDSKLGFTAGQRQRGAQRYQADVSESQGAHADYEKAQSDFDKLQASMNAAADRMLHPGKPGAAAPDKPGGGGVGFVPPEDVEGQKQREAAVKEFQAAMTRLQEQSAQARFQAQKAAAEQSLAELESDHKMQLVSEQDFIAQRAALERKALDAELGAARERQADIDKEIRQLQQSVRRHGGSVSVDLNSGTLKAGRGGDPDAIKDEAKIADWLTRRLEITGQISQLQAKGATIELDTAAKVYELKKKQLEISDQLAAERESANGGSVIARLKQSSDEYADQRLPLQQALSDAMKGGDSSAIAGAQSDLGNADANFTRKQDGIRASGAEERYGLAHAQIQAQRSAVDAAEARGGLGALAAQQQRIALDKQEAEALQPLLASYERLATGGDLQAKERVIELQTQIKGLEEPVDEMAAHIRSQFDDAFEGLFENISKGKSALESFLQDIEHMVMQQAYKRAVQPYIQNMLGKIFSNRGGGDGDNGNTLSGGGGESSAASNAATGIAAVGAGAGMLASLFKSSDDSGSGDDGGRGGKSGLGALLSGGGLFGKMAAMPTKATGGGGVTVNLINQTSSPASATATQGGSDGSALTELMRPHVIEILMQDLQTNGSIAQSLSGGSGGLLTA